MPLTNTKRIIRSSTVKAVLLTTIAIYLSLCFVVATTRFNSTDREPYIQDIGIAQEKLFAAFTVNIQAGLFIRNFSYFSILENRFVADMLVWYLFDSTEVSLKTIENFSFENGTILKKSLPDIRAMDDKTFVKYNVVVELKTNLDYRRFPLEDHKVSIILTNHFVTPYEVMFDVLSSDFAVAPDLFVSNWHIKDLKTNFGVGENILSQTDTTKKILYPKMIFTIDFIKAGLRKAFTIFAPIFIIFFFALFSFLLTLGNTIGRTSLSVAALTALLGYRFVIERMMPKVGYFTTTDYIYINLLEISFLIFTLKLLIVSVYKV